METTNRLVDSITKGIQEKKGQNITIVDLRGIDGAITNYFVICQGGSPSQVEAITDSVEETVRTETGEKPVNVNGLGNSQWVAMDYIGVVVDCLIREPRYYYNLENVWEDAKVTNISNLYK